MGTGPTPARIRHRSQRPQPRRDLPDVIGIRAYRSEDAANLELSTRRAEAVKRWLSAEGGVAESRIRTTGYGESSPVA